MAKITIEEAPGIPDGDYVAKCEKIEEGTAQFGDVFYIHFKLLDAPENAPFHTITAMTDKLVAIGRKTYKWFCAINGGKDLELGASFDTDDFVGKQCKVVVENKPNAKGQIYPRIVNIIPIRKGQEIIEKEATKETPKPKDEEFESGTTTSAPADEEDDF